MMIYINIIIIIIYIIIIFALFVYILVLLVVTFVGGRERVGGRAGGNFVCVQKKVHILGSPLPPPISQVLGTSEINSDEILTSI